MSSRTSPGCRPRCRRTRGLAASGRRPRGWRQLPGCGPAVDTHRPRAWAVVIGTPKWAKTCAKAPTGASEPYVLCGASPVENHGPKSPVGQWPCVPVMRARPRRHATHPPRSHAVWRCWTASPREALAPATRRSRRALQLECPECADPECGFRGVSEPGVDDVAVGSARRGGFDSRPVGEPEAAHRRRSVLGRDRRLHTQTPEPGRGRQSPSIRRLACSSLVQKFVQAASRP